MLIWYLTKKPEMHRGKKNPASLKNSASQTGYLNVEE